MSGLAALERALRGVCASVDVDASEATGSLPRVDAEAVFNALVLSPESLASVALRTAALACVEPQVNSAFAAEVLSSIERSGAIPLGVPEESGVDRESHAASCVRAAGKCVLQPNATAWFAMLTAYRAARLVTNATSRQVSNLWLDWAGRLVPSAAQSQAITETAWLSDVLRSQRSVPAGEWYFEGGVNDSGVHIVSITSCASRRMVHDVLEGTMTLEGRTLSWTVRALDGLPLTRVRTEDLVERVLLSELMNGHYEGRYDQIDYKDVDAKTSWSTSTD